MSYEISRFVGQEEFLTECFAAALEQGLLTEVQASAIEQTLLAYIEQEAINTAKDFSPTEAEIERIAEVTQEFLRQAILERLGGQENVELGAQLVASTPAIELVTEGRQNRWNFFQHWIDRYLSVARLISGKKSAYFSDDDRNFLPPEPYWLLKYQTDIYYRSGDVGDDESRGYKSADQDGKQIDLARINGEINTVRHYEMMIGLFDWLAILDLPGFQAILDAEILTKDDIVCCHLIVGLAVYGQLSFEVERDDLTFIRENLIEEGRLIDRRRELICQAGNKLAEQAPAACRDYLRNRWFFVLEELEKILSAKRLDWQKLGNWFVFSDKPKAKKPVEKLTRNPSLSVAKISRLKLEFPKAGRRRMITVLGKEADISTAIDLLCDFDDVERSLYILEHLDLDRLADILSAKDQGEPYQEKEAGEERAFGLPGIDEAWLELNKERKNQILTALEGREHIWWLD